MLWINERYQESAIVGYCCGSVEDTRNLLLLGNVVGQIAFTRKLLLLVNVVGQIAATRKLYCCWVILRASSSHQETVLLLGNVEGQ